MEFDVRTRTLDDLAPVDAVGFHESVLPELLELRSDLASRAFVASGLRGITVGVGDAAWHWSLGDRGRLEVTPGDPGEGVSVRVSPEWFSDIVNDVRSTVALMIADEADMVRGNITHVVAWEPVLRALTDGRAAYEPGLVGFTDPDGGDLDLDRVFTLDDDPADVAHFLDQAGYAHFRQVFAPEEMQDLSLEIDRWRSEMSPVDERAWYAAIGDERVCVRVTNLGPEAVRFPHEERLAPIAAMVGGERRYRGSDLLVKPVGVTSGISDLPWHKDCALGGHSYRCRGLTCGVSVTPSGEDNGRLGVVAGSHRVNIPLFDLSDGLDLPVRWLDTEVGDVTVHLSCVLHCATPPVHSERRVTYSDFPLPGDAAVDRTIRAVRDQAGRETYSPA